MLLLKKDDRQIMHHILFKCVLKSCIIGSINNSIIPLLKYSFLPDYIDPVAFISNSCINQIIHSGAVFITDRVNFRVQWSKLKSFFPPQHLVTTLILFSHKSLFMTYSANFTGRASHSSTVFVCFFALTSSGKQVPL